MTENTNWKSLIANLGSQMLDPNLSDEAVEKLQAEQSNAHKEWRKEVVDWKSDLNTVVELINKRSYTHAEILAANPKVHAGFATGAKTAQAPSGGAAKAATRTHVPLASDDREPFLRIPREIFLSEDAAKELHHKVHDVDIRTGRTAETYLKTNKMFGSLPQPLQRIVDKFDSAKAIEAELTKHVVDNESAKTYASSEEGQQEISKLAEFLATSKKSAKQA